MQFFERIGNINWDKLKVAYMVDCLSVAEIGRCTFNNFVDQVVMGREMLLLSFIVKEFNLCVLL